MHFQESEIVELKEVVTVDIKKEIVAFANCDGGKLYIGVKNDGTVAGLDNPDEAALQISNMVRDAIKPDVTMFLYYETMKIDSHVIVVVDIQRGTHRPYYIAKKGMRPEGVYVRQGYSSVPATDSRIRQMIKETDGDQFERMRSIYQELTFETVKHEFQIRNIKFALQQMRTLGFIDQDGLYTNMAYLLSDQCAHTIKLAVFQGNDQAIFKDRREFSGSLIQQMNEIYEYIDFHNLTHATIDNLLRNDVRDYPPIALREALLNLLVHRDYTYSASAFINLYKDRIEFISIGGLLPGILLEDVLMGISICRNQNLAKVFYRLHLIEAYGTGIGKIMQVYEKVSQKPVIETSKNAFKIILPNMNYTSMNRTIQKTKKGNRKLSDEEEKILAYIKAHGFITRNEVVEIIDTSTSTATRMVSKMVDNQILKRVGKARNTKYTIMK